jgi:hypothetical protein
MKSATSAQRSFLSLSISVKTPKNEALFSLPSLTVSRFLSRVMLRVTIVRHFHRSCVLLLRRSRWQHCFTMVLFRLHRFIYSY